MLEISPTATAGRATSHSGVGVRLLVPIACIGRTSALVDRRSSLISSLPTSARRKSYLSPEQSRICARRLTLLFRRASFPQRSDASSQLPAVPVRITYVLASIDPRRRLTPTRVLIPWSSVTSFSFPFGSPRNLCAHPLRRTIYTSFPSCFLAGAYFPIFFGSPLTRTGCRHSGADSPQGAKMPRWHSRCQTPFCVAVPGVDQNIESLIIIHEVSTGVSWEILIDTQPVSPSF